MLSREPSLALLGVPRSSHLIAHDGAGSPARQLGPVTGEQHIRPPLLVPPSRRHHSQAGTALSGAASAQTSVLPERTGVGLSLSISSVPYLSDRKETKW